MRRGRNTMNQTGRNIDETVLDSMEWIQKNLRRYRFYGKKARTLRKSIKKLNLNRDSKTHILKCYNDWFALLQNNPAYAVWRIGKTEAIIGKNMRCYFVEYSDKRYFPIPEVIKKNKEKAKEYFSKCEAEFDQYEKEISAVYEENRDHAGALKPRNVKEFFWFRKLEKKIESYEKAKRKYDKLKKKAMKGKFQSTSKIPPIDMDGLIYNVREVNEHRKYRKYRGDYRKYIGIFGGILLLLFARGAIVLWRFHADLAEKNGQIMVEKTSAEDEAPTSSENKTPESSEDEMSAADQDIIQASAGATDRVTAQPVKRDYTVVADSAWLRKEPASDAQEEKDVSQGSQIFISEWTGSRDTSIWGWGCYDKENKCFGWINIKTLKRIYENQISVKSCRIGNGKDLKVLYDGNVQTKADFPCAGIEQLNDMIILLEEEALIEGIVIYSGNYNYDEYPESGMVSKMKILIDGKSVDGESDRLEQEVKLERKYDLEGVTITLDRKIIANKITIRFLEAVEGEQMGKDYENACVSEVYILGNNMS